MKSRIAIIVVIFMIVSAGVLLMYELQQKPVEKLVEKEYFIAGHDDTPFVVYTSQGIYLVENEEKWNSLQLNHTYKCDEIYSGVAIENCKEIDRM